MPAITIDGKTCDYSGEKTILQVALEQDVEIPHYCYHPGLSIVASCRICLAEVASPNPRKDNKVELIPKLVPTCQTPVTDGMIVYTQSPKSIANQKAVMEYLLINHPLDCPVCDQAGECHLQDYSYRYGRSGSRFIEDKIKQPTKDIGPNVKLYADRCIMCSRCVRFTKEVTGTGEIGVFGRGNTEQIDVFPGVPLDNELSANVVDLCPVGALLDKEFLFSQRVWFLHETPSIDGITASGDNISIHHNEGRIHRIKPRTNMQVNRWWISDEIRYGWQFIHREDRLNRPRRMQYGAPIEIDWDKAYSHVHEKLQTITDPDQAARFVEATGVDLLAVSVGNVHILIKGQQELDLAHLGTIHARVDVPLVLHGGTGIAGDSLKQAIKLGVTKVNYGTYLKQRYLATLRKALQSQDMNPHHLLGVGGNQDVMVACRHAMRDAVRERIGLLNCCGKA